MYSVRASFLRITRKRKFPGNEREHAPVGERTGADVLKLAFGQPQEWADHEVVNDIAVRGGDLTRDLEPGEVVGSALLPGEREVLRLDLDGVVNEKGAGFGPRAAPARVRHWARS